MTDMHAKAPLRARPKAVKVIKLLVVSDFESKYIWDHFDPAVFKGTDLILSCGDLKASYLSYLVTMIPAPLFYIHGNHDVNYLHKPPEGCVDIDGRVVVYKDLRIGGLGGCKGAAGAYQYTEPQMARRVKKFESAVKKAKGLDIFISHAAPLGHGDGPDVFHQGFASFLYLDETYAPRYHFYGHYHLSGSPVNNKAVVTLGTTTLVNASGYRLLEV